MKVEENAMQMHDIEIWERKASMAALLAAMLRDEPNGEWLEELAADKVFSELPYANGNEDAEVGRMLVANWLENMDEASFEASRSDYMLLFVGPATPLAPPWESVCLHADEPLVFQKETLEVRDIYRKRGFQVARLHHEPDDHIAYELEFVSAVAGQAAAALRDGDGDLAAQAEKELHDFIVQHLSCWGFRWTDLVLEHAITDYYRGIGLLVRGWLEETLDEAYAEDAV